MVNKSKFLSLVLRHKPETVGLTLDFSGWALVSDILDKCEMSIEMLKDVVKYNNKKRFEFNEDKTKIRASQGHSIDVDLDYVPTVPPMYLFHGTPDKTVDVILKDGIKKMQRHAVHLSVDQHTAINVGKRRGKPIALTVDARKMHNDGHEFFLSTNGVWLTEFVPTKYIIEMNEYYHDVHCNTNRHEPMGCEGCSCYMFQKLIAAQTCIKNLKKEKAPLYTDRIKDFEKKVAKLQTIIDAMKKEKT